MNMWDENKIPNLTGKVAIVTGGNTGLGYQSCLELAKKNATVIIACRNSVKGKKAIKEINKTIGKKAYISTLSLDLSNYDSIRAFVKQFKQKHNRLDLLMNNAGVVNQKEKGNTQDGNETHFGTNHLGHFALTGLLVDLLIQTPKSRVITLTSIGYKQGNIDFDDLTWKKRNYSRVKSYSDSKLANLLFTLQLQYYFEAKGASTIAVSAHPGLSASPRQQKIGIGGKLSKWIARPVHKGCQSQLLVATAPFIKGNDFYGPRYGLGGNPKKLKIKHKQYNTEVAKKLWQISEKITGVYYI